MRLILLALAAVLAAPQSAAPAQPPAANATARDSRLDAIAEYFAPRRATLDLMIGGIQSGMRTRLARDSGFPALEADYPGLREAMLAAADAEVRRVAPTEHEALRLSVRNYWAGRLSDRELGLFADFVALSSIAGATDARLEVRANETATATAYRGGNAHARRLHPRRPVPFPADE